jgi:hypothetical protein
MSTATSSTESFDYEPINECDVKVTSRRNGHINTIIVRAIPRGTYDPSEQKRIILNLRSKQKGIKRILNKIKIVSNSNDVRESA